MYNFCKNTVKSFLFVDLLCGLQVTLRNLFKKKFTVYYPEEKAPKSIRFRGLHALLRYPNGLEKCIACKLCESICPALAITIESNAILTGVRGTTRYDIDLFKCIYCGLCEEACPVNSIVQTTISDYCFVNKNESVLTKDNLLRTGADYSEQIIECTKGRF